MTNNRLDYLDELEAEAIHILREVAGQFERPALLFSGGKDSITLVRLAEKAFRPGKFPFPLVHIDTGHNFPETIQYRDEMIARLGGDEFGVLSGTIPKSAKDRFFRLHVDRRERVVEDQDRRLRRNRARERDPLLLAAGEIYASLAEKSLVTFR